MIIVLLLLLSAYIVIITLQTTKLIGPESDVLYAHKCNFNPLLTVSYKFPFSSHFFMNNDLLAISYLHTCKIVHGSS